MTYQQRYARLRAAVLAYARALEAYGLLGSPWVEHSDELDRLWQDVLTACEPLPDQPAHEVRRP